MPGVIHFDGNLREFADEFDPDEYAESFIPLRGTIGIPDSIHTIIEDAEDFNYSLAALADALEEWQKSNSI